MNIKNEELKNIYDTMLKKNINFQFKPLLSFL